ncbi:organic cation transporter protein isoform X3 [Schistocerca gregaria]|uniref:organic cation transporter protein isoform X3 n=1 Tax=Schistocerca gregaria TaxID=7010 RepID=UPI00211E5577|nr:organic cation transporter protein isoform X3 [Schistocerca gregaria]
MGRYKSTDGYKPCRRLQDGEREPEAGGDGLEAALWRLGRPGRFLWSVFLLCSLPGVFNMWHLTSYVFQGYRVDHWCHVEPLSARGWTEAQVRNISGQGEAESCSYYNYNYSALAAMGFVNALEEVQSQPRPPRVPCTSHDYDDYHTISSEWDLVCERTALRSTAQMVVSFGKLLGALIFGFIADRAGRKTSLTLSFLIYIVVGPLSGLLAYYWVFVAARLLIGMAGAGCFNCGFTLLTEVCHPTYRTLLSLLYNMSYPLGQLTIPVIAYYLRDWQKLQLAISIPAVVLIFNIWLLPESPRWLIARGQREKAWKIVKKANPLAEKRSVTEIQPVTNTDATVTEKNYEIALFKRFLASTKKLVVMFRHGESCRRLVICFYLWWVSALTYYGLSLNSQNFSSDRYVYTAVSGAVEIVGYLIPIPLLRVMGRRSTSSLLFFISGVALLLVLPVPEDLPGLRMAVAMVGRLCIGAVYSVVILYTSELFPTVVRNTAVGTSATVSHMGATIAPYIVDLLGEKAWYIPSTLCAIVSLFAGMLSLLLPETKGKELMDSLDEMDQRTAQGDRVSCKNCLCCRSSQNS